MRKGFVDKVEKYPKKVKIRRRIEIVKSTTTEKTFFNICVFLIAALLILLFLCQHLDHG